jgi:bifunctional aspartokinase / homoserine dehydrogenase 1
MLRVLKFGGTSVGNASYIRKVAEIVHANSRVSKVVVVVSAISGVTNKLVSAASGAAKGDANYVTEIFHELRDQHCAVLHELISSPSERDRLTRIIDGFLEEGTRLCRGTSLLRELTPRANDAITSLGERLSVPLLAAALKQRGVASEALEATELIVTDCSHCAAEPRLNLTRERCKSRLLPLLKDGVVPVVTGFIGATADGILTTLGRGGSDYSATILGAALGAQEVVIWTDVDGFFTADPRIVPYACTISEISSREASELAFFGAKVLHPKTLRPLIQPGISLWIRNTFAPDKPGTKITQTGAANSTGVTALTAFADAALITVGGPGIAGVPDVLGRTLSITREFRTDVLLVSQSSSENEICLVVPSSAAKLTVEELRSEFAQDLAYEKVEHIEVDSTVAIVTVVGQKIRGTSVVGRTFCALARANVDTVATAHGASDCNFSFVVAKKDMRSALTAIHQEFQLGTLSSDVAAKSSFTPQACSFPPSVEICSLSAD